MISEAVTTQQWERGSHPLLACVESIDAALDAATGALAVGTDPAWLPAHDQGVLLQGLQRIEQRVAALKLATLSAVNGPDGVATTTGARSSSDWLAHRLHLPPRRTGAEARLADRLRQRPVLRAAMLDGVASTDHVRAVLDCLDTLPAGLVTEETACQAEEILTGYCREFTPAQVTHLGRRILELVAPDDADALEAERLERAEREALRRTRLSSKRIGEGLVRVTADVPALHASILHTVLDAIANPARDHLTDTPVDDGQRLGADQRRGQAFCTLLETLDTRDLPHRHGSAVSVAVTIDEATLRDDLRSAGLCQTSGGVEVSLGEARRLMCGAGIWPAVMGGDSVVLDAGRTRRFHTGPMRKAMEIAHPTCQAEGCTVPSAWCHGHHPHAWSHGGGTSAKDGALLCGHHHRRAHDARYETRWSPDGLATFHRRT